MINNDTLYNIIGMCQRAGMLASGNDMVENAIKNKKAFLVIISEDIGESMLKRFNDKASFYNINTVRFGLKDLIGQSIGKGPRSAVAIIDKGFAESFSKKYRMQHPEVNNIGKN